MKNNEIKRVSFLSDDAPGIAGIIYSILANILGPVIVVATICYVLNFACAFAGVDFDAFAWVQEFIDGFPAMLQGWIDTVQGILE